MMSGPKELSFDEILKYMLEHNGRVTNRELVKHFKVFLMNPDMRDEARTTFKKHVNSLTLIKNQNNEKWLILRKKYMPNSGKENEEESKPLELTAVNTAETVSHQDTNIPTHPLPVQLNQDFNVLSSIIQDTVTLRNKAEVRESSSKDIFASPLKDSLVSPLKDSLLSPANDSIEYPSEDIPPKVYPRRKSSDKTGSEKKPSVNQGGQLSSILNQENVSEAPILTSCRSESMLVDNEQKISVKERKQMFNKMASESDVLKVNKMSTYNMQGVEEEDRVSLDQKSEVDPLDLKQKQWIMCAARGEYHALAKMCKENAKLAKTKVIVSARNEHMPKRCSSNWVLGCSPAPSARPPP
ncbi:uncharacterized protein LOC131851240 [Achroia grisella]|uniref:uncharacterized protein LOC131851240 n=1 Tax=Achroia grisella TaxID=688607 RepID=UPI0027D33DD0|nr:uncharacterized protein LOC131851240 [Achroia grisella]